MDKESVSRLGVVASDGGTVGAIIMNDCMAEEEEEKSTGTASAVDIDRLELVNPATPQCPQVVFSSS